jgi:hypothetical protein
VLAPFFTNRPKVVHRFYDSSTFQDDSHLALLLPSDLFLVFAPAAFHFSLLIG